jgi:phosphatidylglycerophosphatase C
MSRAVVAAFDFDGTLTRRDTLLPFLRVVAGRRRVASALAANAVGLARAARRRDERDVVKERVLARCVAGIAAEDAVDAAARYAEQIDWRDDVVSTLRVHAAAGHEIVVVSASPTLYVAPAVARLGVQEVLATELQVERGVLTGRFAGRNCRAEEKVVRLDEWLQGRDVELHAYGNSPDDAAMLSRAEHAVWV